MTNDSIEGIAGLQGIEDAPDHSEGDDSPYRLPNSTVRILRRENVDVYVFPATDGDGHRFMISHPYEFGGRLTGLLDDEMVPLPANIGLHPDWGAYQIFPLAEVSEIRDGYECVRDRIRYGKGQPRIEPDPDALQEVIDALVILEQAVAHICGHDENERERHYRRVSALCEEPAKVIAAVRRAVERQAEPAGPLDRLRTFVSEASQRRNGQ